MFVIHFYIIVWTQVHHGNTPKATQCLHVVKNLPNFIVLWVILLWQSQQLQKQFFICNKLYAHKQQALADDTRSLQLFLAHGPLLNKNIWWTNLLC